MKKVGFIGAYDKTDFLLYIAKILAEAGKKVLVIDSTIVQKAKYVVPVINPTTSYVTEFEEIDVAVGFESVEKMIGYLGYSNEEELEYDIALIDTDSIKTLNSFGVLDAEKKFFVTSFDLYSLKKGLEILSGIEVPVNITKVLFSKEMSEEENDYLDFLSTGYKIIWDDERIYFPFEMGDQSIIIENQRVAKIKFKNLSSAYKESLGIIAEEILEGVKSTEIKKIVKTIEKGV